MPRKDPEARKEASRRWREKNKQAVQEYYQSNKERFRENNQKLRERNREYIQEIKKSGKCFRCGWNEHPCGLDFHHLDPQAKHKNVSWLSKDSHSLETLNEEISKCVLVCANCHRILHNTLDKDSTI